MFLDKLLDRFSRKEQAPPPPAPPIREVSRDRDGFIAVKAGTVTVQDPVGNGRFATIQAGPGVLLFVNDEPVVGEAVVTEADRIRWQIRADRFFDLTLAEDQMTVTLTVIADPLHIPDAVVAEGQFPAVLQPSYSTAGQRRPGSPKAAVLEQLQALGVTYGVDELAIERGLGLAPGQQLAVARGQEPKPANPGRWTWRLDSLGLTQAGQVIAVHEGAHASLPRITVTGETTSVYDDSSPVTGLSAGPGTRLLGGGRLVAAASGRARAVATAAGQSVQVVPVRVLEGDWTGSLSESSDIIVRGHVRDAQITTTGEVVVLGNIEKSEIQAAGILAQGHVALSKLYTMPAGYYAPLRGELAFLQRRAEELGDNTGAPAQVREAWFREANTFVRGLWRKADELRVIDPDFKVAMADLFSLLAGAESAASYNKATGQALSARLGKVVDEATRVSLTGDVQARSLAQTTVWAGRNITVQENIVGCALFCGGSIETSSESTIAQSDLLAAVEVRVGVMTSLRGTLGSTVRCRRVEAREVQAGCAFEFGGDRKEIGAELFNASVAVTTRGMLSVKQA